jgi:hypothetical protein
LNPASSSPKKTPLRSASVAPGAGSALLGGPLRLTPLLAGRSETEAEAHIVDAHDSLGIVPSPGTGGGKDAKLDGKQTTYYESGQKKFQANLKEGKPDGLGTMWYENGQKQAEENYKDGKRDDLDTSWYDNGQKGSEVNYKDGKQDGLEIRWDKDGREITSITYKNSKVVD